MTCFLKTDENIYFKKEASTVNFEKNYFFCLSKATEEKIRSRILHPVVRIRGFGSISKGNGSGTPMRTLYGSPCCIGMYTKGLISQAYVYPHKQSLFTIDNFSSFYTKTGPSQHSIPSCFSLVPPSDFIEDVELWLSTALIFNNRPSITSLHKQAFHRRGVSDISPPWR